jgi:cysteine synthase A
LLVKRATLGYSAAMLVQQDTLALIGNTPLVRLTGPSEATGCDIYGKCEFANPGASVKDRAALFIVNDAEERGLLKPGGGCRPFSRPERAGQLSCRQLPDIGHLL